VEQNGGEYVGEVYINAHHVEILPAEEGLIHGGTRPQRTIMADGVEIEFDEDIEIAKWEYPPQKEKGMDSEDVVDYT